MQVRGQFNGWSLTVSTMVNERLTIKLYTPSSSSHPVTINIPEELALTLARGAIMVLGYEEKRHLIEDLTDLTERLTQVPDPLMRELPGMWEGSDLEGGKADTGQ